ncbi:heterokaryon incompatibility protein-domain-containing protein [Microdochium trichocladiopsis]|uniref:Heterokaryon incompatibility protein-domain-containing protein n=1 Tax=Microdochium trichocladiopsis TaxID=1682393 RepID=A0A9P8Y049_9PEZI|nr:heterokaryon incompatibility protein-domain-containing protein [Microdochium trichocladiopsis]KAH7024411.1 heterokaryon incompatibility protein-domain-containing protein [Microdochium trichocladiopsis]
MAKRRISQSHSGQEQRDAFQRSSRRRPSAAPRGTRGNPDTNQKPILPPLIYPEHRIRLLQVNPGAFDDEIHCAVTTCALEQAPLFHAISYTWGDPKDQEQIFVDGRQMTIRQNCHFAIQQARHHSPGVPIWIDSICINQDDAAEKSAQVQIMGDIYAKASSVLACIGPSDAASDFVIKFAKDIDARLADLKEEESRGRVIREDGTSPLLPGLWRRLSELSRHWASFTARPYFGRLWVMQELHEGSGRTTVLCGTTPVEWDEIRIMHARLGTINHPSCKPAVGFMSIMELVGPPMLQSIRGQVPVRSLLQTH